MSQSIHIILYVILFVVVYLFSNKANKHVTSKQFWTSATSIILLFIFIEGCRWGRGPDYLAYKYRFEHISPINEPQKGFLAYMTLLDGIGLNYVGLYMMNALIFIVGTFAFIRRTFDKEIADRMYFFAFLSMFVKAESMIRQYIAVPFVFLAISCLIRKEWKWCAVWFLLSNSIHSGTIVMFVTVVLAYFLLKRTIPYKYLLIGLFLAYYVIPGGVLTGFFTDLLQKLNLGFLLASDHLSHYIENSDRWLGADSYIEAAEQTIVTKTLQFLFESSVVILGYKALSLKEKTGYQDSNEALQMQVLRTFFNVTTVGFIFERLFFGFEIFQRMTGQLVIFWFVPLGYALYVYRNNSQMRKMKWNTACVYLSAAYLVMYWGRFIFLNPTAKFIWD